MHPNLQRLLQRHAPGVFPGIPAEAYHQSEGVSRSLLDLVGDSPFELHHELTNGSNERTKSYQTLGTLVDFFIEHGATDRIPAGWVAIPNVSLSSKEGRKLKAENEGCTLVKDSVIDTARECFDAVMRRKRLAKVVEQCERQLSVYSDFEVEGIQITRRCRPDLLPKDSNCLIDLKTTSSELTEGGFWYEMRRWGYHRQAAWYMDTCAAAGTPRELFCLLVVETATPFRVKCFSLTPEDVEIGRQANVVNLSRLVKCLTTDTWEDDSDVIRPLQSPYKQNQ